MASHGHWEHILLINAISGVEEHLRGSKSIRCIERHIPWASNAHQLQTHCFPFKQSGLNLITRNTCVKNTLLLLLGKNPYRISCIP